MVVAVTGGARGIGAAIAETLAADGAAVAVGDVDLARAQQTAERCGAEAFELDVRDSSSWKRFVGSVEARLGPVEVLVSNAGIMPVVPFLEQSEETARRQVDINLMGVILGCQAVLPSMVQRGSGHLVNIASQAGKAGIAGVATYCATKFAVVGLSHSLEDELRSSGVSVTCVLPGVVHTELSAGLPQTRFAPRIEPEEVARAVQGAIQNPRREVWVPASGQFTMGVAGRLPSGVRGGILRALRLEDPMLRADFGIRAEYEERVGAALDETDGPDPR